MTADNAREFDFTRTVQLTRAGLVIAFLAWLSTAIWVPTDQPRWLVVTGAAAIGLAALGYGRIVWARLVRRAVLDDRRLRVITASGREHLIERDDVVVRGLGILGDPTHIARLHHPGGELYVLRPAGAELADLLRGSWSGR
jgi:hypothetical protein